MHFQPRLRGAVAAVLLLLAGCRTHVTPTGGPTEILGLTRPTAIVVQDFGVDPMVVKVDPGLGATLRRDMSDTDYAMAQQQAAHDARAAMSDTLLQEIAAMNLPVQAYSGTLPPAPVVVVRGFVTSIDEGNSTRRNIVGFGAGRANIQASAEVLYYAPGQPPYIMQSFAASTQTGRTPGLGVGAASAAAGRVGAAAVNTGAHAATYGNSEVAALTQDIGEQLASSFGKLFAEQNWIPPGAR